MDFFVSTDSFHLDSPLSTAQERFSEQLVRFNSLGFYFTRPLLDPLHPLSLSPQNYMSHLTHHTDIFYVSIIKYLQEQQKQQKSKPSGSAQLLSLVSRKSSLKHDNEDVKLILCPQHLPKLHPSFDEVLLQSLIRNPQSLVVLIEQPSKNQWKRTLMERWKNYLKDHQSNHSIYDNENVLSRIQWISPLSPTEYLILLAIGDVMIDPYPFGGGVTTLESLAMCTPVVTLPSEQTVPALATGILRAMQLPLDVETLLIVENVPNYLHSIDSLLSYHYIAERVRMSICQQHFRIFEQKETLLEWNKFLLQLSNTII